MSTEKSKIPSGTDQISIPPDTEEKPNRENLLAIPGQEDDGPAPDSSLNRWHDFESQYSLAVEKSAIIEREKWGSHIEFLMSCIASAVGLGNIWRFPFICGQNGGGAFLLPYLVVLTVIGRPLYMLELGLGQFVSSGPVKIWEMNPGFRGVGYGATIASFFVSTFYCVIMGWALLYLFYSLWKPLPWESKTWEQPLQPDWNKPEKNLSSTRFGSFFGNAHLGDRKQPNESDFYLEKGLDGPPVFNLAMGLLAAWTLVWLVLIVGVSGSGKIAYFTALFPYVVLFTLLAAGCTLEGAGNGVEAFFTPDWDEILNAKTWFQAVGQCFFSLGITFGGCVMFSSFNDFHHKLGRDIVVISIMDTFTSVLAGVSIYCLIGHLQVKSPVNPDTMKKPSIAEIAGNGGAGMAFVTFPSVLETFGKYPGPQIFSFLFFFMIIVLAVGSANGLVGTTVTVICDAFPSWNRRIVITVMCISCFFLGMIYICPTGNNIIDIVDKHGSEMVVYVMAIFETIGIAWIYGLRNITNDFEFMLSSRINLYWVICWAILPILLLAIFICFLVTYQRNPKWPPVAVGSGWVLTIMCWCILPFALIRVIQTRKSSSFLKRLKASFFPSRRWGPKDPAVREAWRRWKKTKPIEYCFTTKIFLKIGLRTPADKVDPQAYWSTDIESDYQPNISTQGLEGNSIVNLEITPPAEGPQ